uniref:Uncharacterized protein n=1 Tax=Clytia hemisphaerica TaxID=252671 RepID=A0A7M5XAK0_9CNID
MFSNLTWFVAVLICWSFVDWKVDAQLSPGKPNVCSATIKQLYYVSVRKSRIGYQNYRTCCKRVLRACTSRCTRSRKITVYYTTAEVRYKQGYRYFCCSGWARQGDSCPTPICNPGCVNGHCSRPGVCTCKSGYNGNRCEKDIDECLRKPCDQTCKNLPGTYACSCRTGYKKINNDPKSRQCVNVNECLTTPCKCAQPKNCKATCTDTTGSFKCSCNKGFKLGYDQRTCEDINECSSKALNGCQHKCLNNMGSFTCACNKGYKLLPDGKSCQDINECSTLNGGCNQICTNKPGSFQCSCRRGFRLSSDGKTCKDINECSEQKPCDNNNGICKNTFGSYQCFCEVGFQLLSDKKTCRDINECSKKELNGCQHKCSNTVGSFFCSCNVGYRLNADKKKCDDINECIEQTDKCGHNCHNTIGSYTCSCRPGYRLNGDKILCKALPCVTVSSLNHGNISCTGYVTDQSCSYECHSGFNLLGSDQRTCLPSSQWSGNAPQCQRKDCPTIEAPEHGSIMIPCVAKYGFTCLKKCSKGFYLDGTTSAKCVLEGNQTTWTAKDSICRASTPCEPNPCLNNGQCLETSIDTFVCDCSGTLSKGKLCDIGIVDIPTLPQLVLNQWSTDIEIMARPTAFVNIVPKSRMELTFDPPEIRIEVPESSAKFQILSSKTGVFEVEFVIQGRNDFEFETPKPKQVYVFPKKTSLLVDMDISTVIDNAKLIQRNLTDTLVLKSMCSNGENVVGFTTIQSKSVVLPVSMVGVEKVTLTALKERGILNPVDEIESFLKTKEISIFDYQCVNATSELAQQVEYAIKYNFFQAAYLKKFTVSMPTWFELAKTFSEPEYNSANLASQLVTLEDIFSLKCYATGSQGKNRLSKGIHSLYQPYTPVLLKILDKKFEMSKTNRICYFANLEENSFHINSDSPVNFISSPSPDHIFEKLQSSYMSVSPTKEEFFVDFSMKMKSFDGRFKGKGFMTLEDSDKFFTRMFDSQNKISGNIALDFDVNLKFLGKTLAVEGKSTQAEYNLTSSGKRDATLKLTTSVNQIKFQSPNAAIRFSPRAKSKLSIEVPMLATGGQIRSISNENALKTYSRYLTRAERNSQGVGNLLATLDQKLADIWSSKTTEYFKHLGNFNTFVMMGLDSTNYYEAINTLQPVKESYINFKSFANVLVENFKNENANQRLVLALRNVLRALSRTDQLEILPQLEPIKFVDVNGLQMKYSGGLCIYQLCFPSMGSIEIDSPFNKNHITIKSNLTTFNASSRLHFTDKDSLQINIDKHIGTFTATLTGNLKVFDKVFSIQFSFDQDKFAYSSTISVEGFPSTGFTVSKTKQISNVQWEDKLLKQNSYKIELQ